jgi:hypothetical protein
VSAGRSSRRRAGVRLRRFLAAIRRRPSPPAAPDPKGDDPRARHAPDPTAPLGSITNPVELGPEEGPLAARLEAAIARVREEHLSYLEPPALRALAACVLAADEDGIPGLIVEAGTARGGSAIVMATAKSPDRPMRVYDVFGMIPPPSEQDGADVHRRYATITSGASKGIGGETYYGYREDLLGEVTGSFARHGVPVDEHRVELVQGVFEETITGDDPVAVAHLDGDWYASTMTCLTRLAPRLAPGGRLIIDDYDTWSGCHAAVHDYFDAHPGFRFERRGRLHVVRPAAEAEGPAVAAASAAPVRPR